MRVKLEIDADVADGVPSKTVMGVTENAPTLKFSDFRFEKSELAGSRQSKEARGV